MGNVKRVYVEKKPEYAVQAKELKHEVKSYLGIENVTNIRILIRYDVENISQKKNKIRTISYLGVTCFLFSSI